MNRWERAGVVLSTIVVIVLLWNNLTAAIGDDVTRDGKIEANSESIEDLEKTQDKTIAAVDKLTEATNTLNANVMVLQALMPKKTDTGT